MGLKIVCLTLDFIKRLLKLNFKKKKSIRDNLLDENDVNGFLKRNSIKFIFNIKNFVFKILLLFLKKQKTSELKSYLEFLNG